MKLLLLLLVAALQTLTAQPDRFGLPACDGPNLELADRAAFRLCYSHTTRTALWTAHQLDAANLNPGITRQASFRRDILLAGPTPSDYRNTGFHRGHLVPSADFAASEPALRQTFLLSNAVPQNPALNTGKWRILEAAIRNLAGTNDTLLVITGVLFDTPDPLHIGPTQIAVPTHIFKVVLAINGNAKRMYAAILPNTRTAEPLAASFTTVDELERRANLDFFAALPDDEEHRLESTLNRL